MVKMRSRSKNKQFVLLTVVYSIFLLIVAIIACVFSYNQKQDEYLAQMEMTYMQLSSSYVDRIDNFWQAYMPLFESGSSLYPALKSYYTTDLEVRLSPMAQRDLMQSMRQMLLRDDDIRWIALYSTARTHNYILFRGSTAVLREMTEDFPYLDRLTGKLEPMRIFETKPIDYGNEVLQTYALSGGIPAEFGGGKIIVGYDLSVFNQICASNPPFPPSLQFQITTSGATLYNSSGVYKHAPIYIPTEKKDVIVTDPSGQRVYVRAQYLAHKSSVASYSFVWSELFRYANVYTLRILLIVLLFEALSLLLYVSMLHLIAKEVRQVQDGLTIIGKNHLDYRLSTDFKQSGLPEIATSINQMTEQLSENINKAYYYQLKQKESELSELQSKFNPHFLYNCLEIIRSRCAQNGDPETASLIAHLAAIFRGFISSQNFVPLRDELTFSKRYLSLFCARYNDQVDIQYNFPTEILQYGIIRNVFQPLIENYFVHGFDVNTSDNYILFQGTSMDNDTVLITVEDNGCGMTDEQATALNEKLHEPIHLDTESYGLKNLHQRLRLFYGEKCGLTIKCNERKGISVQMVILKMTCEEYARQTQIRKERKGTEYK